MSSLFLKKVFEPQPCRYIILSKNLWQSQASKIKVFIGGGSSSLTEFCGPYWLLGIWNANKNGECFSTLPKSIK